MDMENAAQLCRENLQAMEMYARLLRMEEECFSADEIDDFAKVCGLEKETAFHLLSASACGLEPDRKHEDKHLMMRYLVPALKKQDAACFRQNPYYSRIKFPEASLGEWRMTQLSYAPYQIFPCGDTVLLPDGREIAPMGYFTEGFSFPAVTENGREWMAIKPNETETMKEPIQAAYGNAVVFGLGLGYYAFMVSEKENVSSVTVIERDKNVISLFQKYLLPQFPHGDKIRIVQADAFDYLKHEMRHNAFDFAFADIWHDISDGLPLYLKFRKAEQACPGVQFKYWIEPSMLVFLRSLMLEDWLARAGRLDRLLSPDCFADEFCSLAFVRQTAPEIDPAELW